MDKQEYVSCLGPRDSVNAIIFGLRQRRDVYAIPMNPAVRKLCGVVQGSREVAPGQDERLTRSNSPNQSQLLHPDLAQSALIGVEVNVWTSRSTEHPFSHHSLPPSPPLTSSYH
ncbi:hypothetical protein J6590_054007 [Homalodisca vitripennis]|nr:hypothetical protein J6590_054007 [Homalodisca vitripennis]